MKNSNMKMEDEVMDLLGKSRRMKDIIKQFMLLVKNIIWQELKRWIWKIE